jgi:hypothetical protein
MPSGMKILCTYICVLVFWSHPALADDDAKSGKINGDRDAIGPSGGRKDKWSAAPDGYSAETVKQWASAHQTQKGAGYKYVFLPPEQAGKADVANTLRVAMGKAWNHLHWKPEISIPEDISNGAGLAFALNAQAIWGADAERNWGYIAGCTRKSNISVSPASTRGCQAFDAAQPVPIPRFVFNAVNGGPYGNIHNTPGNYSSFRNKFRMGPITHTATNKEAIVCGPRITAFRTVQFNGQSLVYSYSSDEFNGRDNGDIRYTNAPTDRNQRSTGALFASPNNGNTAIASEWWMQLPNGFMYWGIHGEGSQERGRAETPFAIDPANWRQNWELQTGRSCITCHASGVQSRPSDETFAGKNGWSSNEELANAIYKPVREKFQAGMKQLVDALSDGNETLNGSLVNGTLEPVSRAILLIEGPYTGGNCEFFCNGKYGRNRQNLCATLPAR